MLLSPAEWELIVVDNNSSDKSVEMIEKDFAGAILLANKENLGFGKANNLAFAISRGKYVLLLNPDTLVVEHAVDRMLKILEERPDLGALGCSLLNVDRSFQRWTGGNVPNLGNVACHFLFLNKIFPPSLLPLPIYLEHEPAQDLDVGWVSGACMLLRREALGKTIFDERFFLYGEDMDLCDRLIRGGWKVLYTPHARIVHLEGRSLQRQSAEIQVSKVRAMREIFAKRRGRTALFAYDLVVTFGFLMRAALFGLAALLRPGHGYELRTTKSRQFSVEAMRALIRR
jgi:N-acetylglucosaminyl-diphospho-decaprenol L-rhamnosyltransferase